MHLSETLLLSDTQYQEATTRWTDAASEPADVFSEHFALAGVRSTCASFRATDITQLLSSVGIATVKARFVIIEGKFSIVLFACDDSGAPLSAYFQGAASTDIFAVNGNPNDGSSVPDVLASTWMNAWTATNDVTKALLSYDNSFLQGYTFKVKDFIEAFFAIPFSTDREYEVRVNFAIHKWYGAGTTDVNAPNKTFGVVLNMLDRTTGQFVGGFYDLTTPCPPTC